MRPTGDLLGGRYRLDSVLASGGMGRVWRGHDTLLDRPVAVKVLRSEYTGDPSFLQRFRAEARHAALLTDPHIAAVHDYGETVSPDGEPLAYLVMELVAGEPLSAVIARTGGLDATETLRIVRQAAAGLATAHAAGVIHRDVKPGNLLVRPDGGVKITDFGIAFSASSVPMTQTGQVMGTAQYISPEQVQGAKASPASDVYGLGVVAHQCLTGRVPFDAESPVQVLLMHVQQQPPPLPADVPPDVRALVARAMAKDPAARFPDGAALRDAADAVLAGRPAPSASSATLVLPVAAAQQTTVLPADASAPVDVPEEAPRRRRLLAGALALLVLALAGVAVVLGTRGDPSSSAAPSSTPPSSSAPSSSAPTTTEPAPPPTVDVVAAALVGRPLPDVQAELAGLGLQVQPGTVVTGDVPEGQVVAVDPAGPVVVGSTVTVTYATPPPAQDEGGGDSGEGGGEDEGGDDEGPGNGNGNGNGRGNGNGGDD
ncbi:protein kinase domain-containing protein [Geodermatophilus sp. SYSU D00684]